MRILLINPSLAEANISHYKKAVEKNRGIYPPLGIAYVASGLKKAGHEVRLIDCDAEEEAWRKISQTCRRFKPELVGFYAMTWTFRQANELLIKIKKISPKIKSVVGGPNVSAFPRESLLYGDFDFAVKGEGEITVVELIEAIAGKRKFSSVDGLLWRRGKRVVRNKARNLIRNLDSISFPAWDLLPVRKYFDVFTQKAHFVTILASRGCPFHCTFCDRENRMGYKWRMRSAQNVVEEMKLVHQNYGISEFMFFDDNFIIDKKWVYDFCQEIEPLGFLWEVRARVDMVDLPLLRAMKKAGCYRIRYGMESADNKTLKLIKKDITVGQIRKCAEASHQTSIEIFAYFMLGLPEEDEKKMQKTIDLAVEIDPDFVIFSKTILIPGSEMFEWAIRKGYIRNDYWLKFLQGLETNPAPGLETEKLPLAIVEKYVSKGNKKFYLRPNYVLKRVFSIRSPYQLWRQLKMAKAIFLGS